ncbi:RimJ/RimL family protein N-acetyltransferase [Caballeronia udeis]|uniref:RimJ/RimL family protein N-acetyltransferase n=1 Tax=Caballeronia udeis TaxID=1232866 RepID=A0ABW8MP86_9BURK
MSDALPTFETDRLLIRPRTMADYEACLAMDRDPLVTQFIDGPWHDAKAHERFLRERIETLFGDGLGYWSIFPKDSPMRFLGWVLLIPHDAVGPEIEIGWRLCRDAWGYGYASEAAGAVVEHAFRGVGLEKIVADIHPGNAASMKVAEKIGMKFVGVGEHGDGPCESYAMGFEDFLRGSER